MTMTEGGPVRRGPGRPRAGSARVDFAAPAELAAWLASRAERTIMSRAGADDGATSHGQQAKHDLLLFRELLAAELAAMPAVPLGWATALAEVTGGEQMSAAITAVSDDGTFRPVLWAEWAVASADARTGHPGNSYAARHGIDEDALGAWLRGLSPVLDYALRDALSRWWADVQPMDGAVLGDGTVHESASAEGFAAVGLRVTG